MIEYHVNANELFAIDEMLAKYPIYAPIEIVKALTKSAIEVQNIARGQAPTRTGRLRNSIMFEVKGFSAVIQPKVPYALFVEGGTGLYGPNHKMIEPKNKKVLATKVNPGWGTASSSGYFIIGKHSRGQKPNPFMGRTYAVTPPIVVSNFITARDNIIRKMVG